MSQREPAGFGRLFLYADLTGSRDPYIGYREVGVNWPRLFYFVTPFSATDFIEYSQAGRAGQEPEWFPGRTLPALNDADS